MKSEGSNKGLYIRGCSLSAILRSLFICVMILLLIDTIMVARILSLFHFPGELDEFGMAQRGGFGVAIQLENFAKQVGALHLPEVNEVLSKLDSALGLASSPADVARALAVEAKEAQEVIAFARGDASGIQKGIGEGRQTERQVEELQEEVRLLREELGLLSKAAGHAELSGPGIVVRAFDAEDGFRSYEIIHDKDVRDIVNQLFWSGAEGVEIGGRRITAQSSVRCAGPILLVNQQPVAVNPVVIRAIGDCKALADGLVELGEELHADGKVLQVRAMEMITLSAYNKGYDRQTR